VSLSRSICLLFVLFAFSPIVSADCEKQRPVLGMLRYEEDWSLLANPDCKKEWLDDLKYISLGREDWFLSVGGEIRYKYENYDNSGFGTDPPDANGYLLQRYLLHTDWHFGRRFRFFAQFQSGLEDGRRGGPRLTDEDVADLHQGFIDVGDSSQTLIFRLGRQEAEFGSGRLIGESEGLNIRRAFDGVRVIKKRGVWTWNATLFRPVLIRPETFAIPDHKQLQWGTGVIRSREHGGWAIYYIGLDRKFAAFNGKVGRQVSETFGSRVWNQGKIFDFNTDIIFQTGTFASGHVLAGAISSNDGFTLQGVKLRPRFGLRFDYASGDSDHFSPNLNAFNPLFPNPMYSSLSALLGPSNVTDLGPNIHLALDSRTALTLESPWYWRSSIHDGIYGFAGNLIRPANLSSARFIGVQPGITLDHTYSPHFSSSAAYFRFFTGEFLQQTPPGRNVDYLYAILTFRY
jgi:alginate export protein